MVQISYSYSPALKLFHWLTVGLLVVAYGLVWLVEDLVPESAEAVVVNLHKSIGLTILGMTALRFALRWVQPLPALPDGTPDYQRWLARLVQYGFYVVLMALPLVGWAMSAAKGRVVSFFGLFALPPLVGANDELAHQLKELHETLGFALVVLAGLHVLGALYHHYLRRDNVLRSMMPHSG